MDSKLGIQRYRSQNKPDTGIFKALNTLSEQLIKSTSRTEFNLLIAEHESIIAKVIDQPKVQSTFFPDYQDGVIKSLGAWGGDFILVSGNTKSPQYFKQKGYNTVIPFEQMVIKKPRS